MNFMEVFVQVWKDCERPIDYFFAFWIYFLFGMFCLGMTQILYALISGDVNLNNVSFGIFDTLG